MGKIYLDLAKTRTWTSAFLAMAWWAAQVCNSSALQQLRSTTAQVWRSYLSIWVWDMYIVRLWSFCMVAVMYSYICFWSCWLAWPFECSLQGLQLEAYCKATACTHCHKSPSIVASLLRASASLWTNNSRIWPPAALHSNLKSSTMRVWASRYMHRHHVMWCLGHWTAFKDMPRQLPLKNHNKKSYMTCCR